MGASATRRACVPDGGRPAGDATLGIFRKAAMVRADLNALLFLGTFFGFQFIVTLYLQELRGWSSLEAAIALIVMGCDAVLAPTLTPRLVNRYGNSRVIFSGFAGAAFALAYGPLTIVATDSVTKEEQGLPTGCCTRAPSSNSASPGRSPRTSAGPGRSRPSPADSPPPGSAAGSGTPARTCPARHAHRNPTGPAPPGRSARRTGSPPPVTTWAKRSGDPRPSPNLTRPDLKEQAERLGERGFLTRVDGELVAGLGFRRPSARSAAGVEVLSAAGPVSEAG